MENQKNLYRDCWQQGTKRPPFSRRVLGGIFPPKSRIWSQTLGACGGSALLEAHKFTR